MEKAVLVGVKFKNDFLPLRESLEELEKLALSAGAETISVITQSKEKPDSKYFVGEGKVEEIKSAGETKRADLIIFDHEISPAQNRNLEEALNIKVIDRTELILDIFSQHAHSHEGKIQVELAQQNFRLTRLTGHGTLLSRLGGGIGTRGPGEQKLEVDRRQIKKRISILKDELEKIRSKRQLLRAKRKSTQIKIAVLVGYTNSGKSTLLNSLTQAGVLVEDKLFATLDPVTRRLYLPNGKTILITDTVGFIQKLPHQLINAFRATLEETIEADLLLHVIDASCQYTEYQIEAVYHTLEELKVTNTPILNVFNKIDAANVTAIHESLLHKYQPSVAISAREKIGLDELLLKISGMLDKP